jgi:hypothetical protein
MLFSSSISIYDVFLNNLNEFDKSKDKKKSLSKTIKCLWMGLGVSSTIDLEKAVLEKKFIINQVSKAIFIHNLYPCEEIRNYKTNRQTEPFAYLVMLADGIQRWDRKRLVSQAKSDIDPKYIIPGNLYDIEIDKNHIKIYTPIYDGDIDLRKSLSQFLYGIESFLIVNQY